MSKRLFVLIDQSIKAPGGHHYEYAKRILDAARELGHDTLLLAHKSYKGTIDHEVVPTFTCTFWDNYNYYHVAGSASSTPFLRGKLQAVQESTVTLKRNLKRRLLFSRLGLAATRARDLPLRDLLLAPRLTSDHSQIRSPRLLLLACFCVLRATHVVRKIVRRFGWLRRFAPHIRRLLVGFLGALFFLPIVAYLLFRGRIEPAQQFANEFRQVASRLSKSDPLFFVPNATTAELRGVGALSRKVLNTVSGDWAFLYRRPLFAGHRSTFFDQSESRRTDRLELSRLRNGVGNGNATFYTDTEELTEQYNFLGALPFRTLPVPVDIVGDEDVRRPSGEKLVVGYLGDARDEKGYGMLPNLVECLTRDETIERSIEFLFQSNFNVPEGEPESRYARHLLTQMDSSKVRLPEGPFDSAEYSALLDEMDVVLIPYEAENYMARSSGVLVEAISRGKPVLVPSKTWMAGVAERSRYQYLLQLCRTSSRMKAIASIDAGLEEINDRIWTVAPQSNVVAVRLVLNPDVTGYVTLRVQAFSEFETKIEAARSTSALIIEGEVLLAISFPSCSKLFFKVEHECSEVFLDPLETDVNLYESDPEVPLSAGVVVFDRKEELARECLGLVRNYEHHRAAAMKLREELLPVYSPEQLVQKVVKAATDA